ncbi:unnamed protein product (macronuclear) [Paramecium tetraurelia]|uniref:Anaphase-promoting complex subunit 4 WD40 domain-containing protein n=1 Tax=Paramecium tetraurelia TaxID=5888 RepID=A0CMC3_PARTE|nr:uncharacterized protein GSPATT00008419001 [Paramecium tetraurelia]CAK71940.1 unnamed protein product [Paramecium tetraurelia]|eukprot:XP_001439337.1 hypothetical protein (macronuclear) [Paramecium tetraurelia strain d4-2]
MQSSKEGQRNFSTQVSQSTDTNEIGVIEDSTLLERIRAAYKDIFAQSSFSSLKNYQFQNDIVTGEPTKVLSCAFDNTTQFLASANSDGLVNIAYLGKDYTIVPLSDPKQKPGPATCVKWRPGQVVEQLKHTLLSTYANGSIIYWHATSKQSLFNLEDKDNQINCCEFSLDGDKFVKLYDCGKLSKAPTTFVEGQSAVHQNRIFGMKFNQGDHNQLYTGGWDKMVIQWDLRQKKSTGYIFGPCVYGDSMDSKGFQLITASYRDEKQLEIWDTRTLNKLQTIEWAEYANNVQGLLPKHNVSKLYACKFDKRTNYIYAANAGSVFSEIRQFDSQYRCVDTYCCSLSGVMTIDYNTSYNKLSYGTSDGKLGVLNLVN